MAPTETIPPVAGRRTLVTGAGGFIGSHLVDALTRSGAQVRALCRYTSRSSRGALEWLEPDALAQVDVVFGDLRDPESASRAVDGCELVFHLGAQIAIPHSYESPRDFFETNVLGTLNVAMAAREAERLVHMSTSEVYGPTPTVPITEEHPLLAGSPYAASKTGADQLVESFRRTYELQAVIVRPFNTYGPRQSARAVIPTIAIQALAGGPVQLGSLEPRRDFVFVEDTVDGLIRAATAPRAAGTAIQLASESSVSIGELVELIGEDVGSELEVVCDPARLRPPDSEIPVLHGSAARARELLGWSAEVSLADGLARTVAWLRERPEQLVRASEYAR